MLLQLARKEILNNLLNLRFVLVYALCTFLVVAGGVMLIVQYSNAKREYELNTNLYQRQASAETNTWAFFRDGRLQRPPTVMSVFAAGGENEADPEIPSLRPEELPVFHATLHRNPVSLLYPSLDMVFIVGLIFSLLVFVLTYDAVAGEREEGTLRVLLSGPAPRDQVLLGKWLGGFVSVLMPFVTGFVLVVTILYFSPSITVSGEQWVRILALLFLCALYIAVIFSISLAFSVMFRHSTTVSMALLVVWAVMVVAWPSAAPYLAYALRNPPATTDLETEVFRMTEIDDTAGPLFHAAYAKLFGDKKQEQLTKQEAATWAQTRQALTYEVWKHSVDTATAEADKFTAAERAPEALSLILSRFSPFGCFQDACIRVAGTGIDREAHLRQVVAAYIHTCWWYEVEQEQKGQGGLFTIRSMPQIRFSEPSIGSAVAGCGIDVGLMALMGILAFLLAYVLFIRMDVT